nr:hypothetical protein [uncultured Pseudodesulfovibrio sp.]
MLLALCGPSAVGKDSRWLKTAIEMGYKKIVPYTTRKKRDGEVDGDDYFFVSKNEFIKRIREKKFLVWDYMLNNFYGTSIDALPNIIDGKKCCIQIKTTMAERIKLLTGNVRTVFLMPSENEVILKRLNSRKYTHEERIIRLNYNLEEIELSELCDVVIPNADIVTNLDAKRILGDILVG